VNKKPKTAQQLQGILAARLNDPQIHVSVVPAAGNDGDWSIEVTRWGLVGASYIDRVHEIANQLRGHYRLTISSPDLPPTYPQAVAKQAKP